MALWFHSITKLLDSTQGDPLLISRVLELSRDLDLWTMRMGVQIDFDTTKLNDEATRICSGMGSWLINLALNPKTAQEAQSELYVYAHYVIKSYRVCGIKARFARQFFVCNQIE